MTVTDWDGKWPDGTYKDFPPNGIGRYWGGVGPVFWVSGTMSRAQFDTIAEDVREQLSHVDAAHDAIVSLDKAYRDALARAESEGGGAP